MEVSLVTCSIFFLLSDNFRLSALHNLPPIGYMFQRINPSSRLSSSLVYSCLSFYGCLFYSATYPAQARTSTLHWLESVSPDPDSTLTHPFKTDLFDPFSFQKIYFYFILSACFLACVYSMCMLGAQGDQKRTLDPLDQKSRVVVNCRVSSGTQIFI